MKNDVWKSLLEKAKTQKLHFTYLDPEKHDPRCLSEIIKVVEEVGSDAIVLGGALNVHVTDLDKLVLEIKKECSLPVIIFPGNANAVSQHADAIFFMTLVNSNNTYWITGAQALGAPTVFELGIEVIPTSYIVMEPGGISSWIGDAKPIPRDHLDIVCTYALFSEYSGKSLIYIDAGFGVNAPLEPEIIGAVKKVTDVPLLTGSGISSAKEAKQQVEAGADMIITGLLGKKPQEIRANLSELIFAIKPKQ
ncbi:MAG: geranylgeranylglyceryl/heptaprenylglyceryl phosphate synthase, partial [Candidatus Diapherotrites archaeon]|nr:geranylgeranylglyceryl/heptaprenylglyceryl phosphate synthase [Candidatus Diapherotrites archaeon]